MDEGRSRGSGTRTVLFTDVVGSTARRSRLGDTATDALEREHDELLRGVVARHSGTVVKGTGDGIMAVFEGAAQGAACAVAMQQALERRARRGGEALEVRIGVSVGDVGWERGDYFGIPVNQAARLEAAAHGGHILASELVRLLAGSRSDARFRPIGLLDLKGLPEPVAACEIEWEPLPLAGPIPLPALLNVSDAMPFVGREREWVRLGEIWAEVHEGRPKTVLVSGEAGIGKTRMASELADVVHGAGGIVLAGRCDSDLAVPYQPFVEALGHVLATAPDDLVQATLGGNASELRRLVPEIVERFPGAAEPTEADPETERHRLFEAVVGWLERTVDREPTLLVVDDLHWASKPTVLLLRHLHRSQRPKRLLVLGTYRPTDVEADHPLTRVLADLRRGPDAERVDLAGLDEASVRALLVDQLERPLSSPDIHLARAIHAGSSGNAFFAGELVRHAVESDAAADPYAEIPDTVRDVVALRMAKLPVDAVDVLVSASVLGVDFDLGILADTAGRTEAAVLDAMEAASQARLVQETTVDRYQFAHGLVRDTLYGGLSRSRRVRLHRLAVKALRVHPLPGGDEDVVALAHHLRVVAADDPVWVDDARAYATRAGDQAMAQLAPDEAARQYETALELLPSGVDDEQRCQLLLRRAHALLQAGKFRDAQRVYLAGAELARQLERPALLAEAAIGCAGPPHAQIMRDDLLVPLLEEALAALPTEDRTRQRVMTTFALRLPDGDDRRVALTRELEGQLHEIEDSTVAGLALDLCFWEFERSPEDRLQIVDRMDELAAASGDADSSAKATIYRPFVLLEQGDAEEAKRSHEAALKWAASAGQSYYREVLTLQCNQFALLEGRFEDVELDPIALPEDEEAGSIGRFLRWILDVQEFQLLREVGRVAEVTPKWEKLADEGAAQGMQIFDPYLMVALAEGGRPAEARAKLEAMAADRFGVVPPLQDPNRPLTLALIAEACWRLRADGAAALAYELLWPYRGRAAILSSMVCLGSEQRYLGLLALTMSRYDEAEHHCREALHFNQGLESPVWEAHVLADLADVLAARRHRGDEEAALEMRRRAAGLAETHGVLALAARLASTWS